MTENTVSVAVAGASGRLGSLVCEVIEQHPGFEVVAKLGSASPVDAGAAAQLLFDVSQPSVSPAIVERALRSGQRVIIGTSGWSEQLLTQLSSHVTETGSAALMVPNFSLGSVIGTLLAQLASPYFSSIEIVESHHAGKVDSPSGTAVRTAELIAQARAEAGLKLEPPFPDQPARGMLIDGVPVHSLRQLGVVAKQEVRFGGDGEVLTITHDTHSKDAYRAGIRAALDNIMQLDGLVIGLDKVLGIEL